MDRKWFVKEAVIMGQFDHPHIVKLLGVCLDEKPPFIVLELMSGGSLLKFLREMRPCGSQPPKIELRDLVRCMFHVSEGCQYLEEHQFIHRDIAARNCLLTCTNARSMIVKLGDFGLARDIFNKDYYRLNTSQGMPIRWLSPEALLELKFTLKSDVWSFGVLMWEIMTLGQRPYHDKSDYEATLAICAVNHLPKPTDCPDSVFRLMRDCWTVDPDARPKFGIIRDQLSNLFDDALISSYGLFPSLQDITNTPCMETVTDQMEDTTLATSCDSSYSDMNDTSVQKDTQPDLKF